MLRATIIQNPLTRTYSYQTPATGFSITIGNNTQFLVLNPAAGLASGTIIMPSNPQDGQVCGFSTSQAITALTVSPNTGQSIVNPATSLGAGGAAQYIYNAALTTWFRAH